MTLQARFIYGAVAGIVALVGLMVAAGASTSSYHTGGLILSGLGLLVCALLIKSHYDAYERDPNRPRRPRPLPAATPAPAAPPPAPQPVGQGFAALQPRRESRFDPQTMIWVRGGVIGVVGLLGLVVAAGGSGFAYWGGLVVFALAVASLFRMIGRAFDGDSGTSARLAPEAGVLRWIVGGLSGVIALLALFLASGGGDGYYIGVMLSLAALAYVFYLIKTSFDEREGH